jgi:hypothetical protein
MNLAKVPMQFVSHSKGVFKSLDGRDIAYDKVELSNGLQSFKVPNRTGKIEFLYHQGDQVMCGFEIEIGKKQEAKLVLSDIEDGI